MISPRRTIAVFSATAGKGAPSVTKRAFTFGNIARRAPTIHWAILWKTQTVPRAHRVSSRTQRAALSAPLALPVHLLP